MSIFIMGVRNTFELASFTPGIQKNEVAIPYKFFEVVVRTDTIGGQPRNLGSRFDLQVSRINDPLHPVDS